MSSAVTRLARPSQLRRLHESQTKRHILYATVGSILSAIGYKVFVIMPLRKAYDDFELTYDREKEFEIMRQKGVFTSC